MVGAKSIEKRAKIYRHSKNCRESLLNFFPVSYLSEPKGGGTLKTARTSPVGPGGGYGPVRP